MKISLKFALPSLVIVLTFILTLLPSKMEAKGFGLDTSYGPCLETSPGNYERPVYEDLYVFWIRIQHEPTGEWVSC